MLPTRVAKDLDELVQAPVVRSDVAEEPQAQAAQEAHRPQGGRSTLAGRDFHPRSRTRDFRFDILPSPPSFAWRTWSVIRCRGALPTHRRASPLHLGAYDGRAVYGAVLAAGLAPRIVVPPIRTATVAGPSEPAVAQRDAAIGANGRVGRRGWKKMAGCHQQARAKNTFSSFKRIFGLTLRARDEEAQTIEASVAGDVLNRMSSLGMPDSVGVPAP